MSLSPSEEPPKRKGVETRIVSETGDSTCRLRDARELT
jgi:hypothetical protein